MKKFLIILLIVFIVFNSFHVPEVYAVGNMIIDNPFNRQLIATMIIASGMVFTSTKQLEDSVTSFIDMWNDHETGWTMPTPKDPQGPNTWEAIIYAAITAGSVVYDVTKGTFKQVLEFTEDFVDFVKQYVDMKYQQFENWLIDPAYWIIPRTTLKTYYFPEKNHHYYVYRWNGTIASNVQYTQNSYFKYSSSTGMYNIRKITGSDTGYWTNSPLRIRRKKQSNEYILECFQDIAPTAALLIDVYTYKGDHIVSTVPLETNTPDVTLPQGTEENLGFGNPDIVDNPEYEYKHNETGTPTIVIPIQSPEADESGYFVPSEDLDDLVDIGASDIANESTDGIIIPAPTPTPTPEPVPYPNLPGEDIPTEYDYDTPNKRALYQLKFPFSLPWDIKAVFQLLNAPAKAPYFEIDIIPGGLKDKIGITGETEFIFDMEEFELIGQVSRFFSFIGFCLTLIYITRFIIKS
jgi:hypothetical protein